MQAIELGYRHIDCAPAYGNEKEIGRALEVAFKTLVRRDEIFITSKLWNSMHHPDDVEGACRKTLDDLQVEYIDLYLIHWPIAFQRGKELFPRTAEGKMIYDYNIPLEETWKAMERLVEKGLTRAIGLSNFNQSQIQRILTIAKVPPAALQIECHPYLTQNSIISFCQRNEIAVTAFSPLGSPDRPWASPGDPDLLHDAKVLSIASKYNKTPSKVILRFQVQRGVIVIPKSVTRERIQSNLEIFDFELSQQDMDTIQSLNQNWRACVPCIEVNGKKVPRDLHHPDFPFHES